MMGLQKQSPFISYEGVLCTTSLEAPPEYLIQHTNFLAAVASVFIGQRGQVIVEGRNDMPTTQKMGISWVIRDPNGIIPAVEGEYSAWELWPNTPADATHTFSGGYFVLDKVGTWTISIALFMNPDSPVAVASYDGVLCVVAEEVFAGKIISMELKYDSVRGDIPVY